MTFCSSRDPTPQKNRARQNCISKHTGVLLIFGSSAIKPQTPSGIRKYMNIVEADSGWRPSERHKKNVDLVYVLGVGRGGRERRTQIPGYHLRADLT